jgi:Uncharacterized conserved protein
MIIAIPVDDNKTGSAVCVSFGRAPYFMFYNTESKTFDYVVNGASDAKCGAGLKAAQLVVDNGAETLLTMRCGQNAADVLTAAQVKVYKTTVGTAEDNLAAFAEGKLSVMTQFHAGFQGHL